MESEEWRVKSGKWRVESGEWKVESESGKWKVESGEWKVESGEWRVESGKWKVESGEWRVENESEKWKMNVENGKSGVSIFFYWLQSPSFVTLIMAISSGLPAVGKSCTLYAGRPGADREIGNEHHSLVINREAVT